MKILVAVDGSETSIKALQAALGIMAQLARPAELALINVHNDSFIRRHQHQVGKQAVDEYLAELHETDLKTAVDLLETHGVRYQVIRAQGDLAGMIAAHAAGDGFDLVVLGSKGRGGLADLVMGSVASKLLAVCKVPVLVVP